jgi:nucleoside-diphosphate-sugar epimerase
VAQACLEARVRRLIYTSTTDVYYSGREDVIDEVTPIDPKIHRRNLYARTKAESERELLAFHREFGLPVVVVRPAIVVGSGGNPHHWGIGLWSSPENCRLWGDGLSPVPLVLVSDVAAALARCLEVDGIEGESFNLAAEQCITPRDYVAALAETLKTSIDIRPTPPWRFFLQDVGKWFVKCLIRHPERRFPSYRDWKSRTCRAHFDCSKSKRVLGWMPMSQREVLLDVGVRRPALEWYS